MNPHLGSMCTRYYQVSNHRKNSRVCLGEPLTPAGQELWSWSYEPTARQRGVLPEQGVRGANQNSLVAAKRRCGALSGGIHFPSEKLKKSRWAWECQEER